MTPSVKFLFSDPAHFVAMGFGAGLVPVLPGTAGSLLGLLLFWFVHHLHTGYYLSMLLGLFVLGSIAAGRSSRLLGDGDPSCIVIDEIFGMLLALLLLPPGWLWLLLGFVLFRAFDILKPWPIGFVDARVPGGLGIMLDDLFAGVYTFIIVQSLVLFRLA